MMRELFLQDLSLWTCLWQSTVFLALGLAAGWLLRRRPSRAYQALLLAMVAAALVPFLSAVVRHGHLGAFPAAWEESVYVSLHRPEPPAQGASVAPPALDASRPVTGVGPGRSPAARPSLSWRPVLLSAWLATALLLLARLVATFLYGVRLVRQAQPSGCEGIQQAAERTASRLRVAHGLQIRTSDRIRSPVVWCWTRPPILLVPRALGRPDVEWTGVVAHELAHCRRRDHVTGLIAELMASLLPWNPLMWLARRFLIRLGEQACDDWVVASGQSSEDYAESLLRFRPQKQMAFWPAVVSSKSGLAHRIRRILNEACGNPHAGAKWALALSVVAIGVGVGVAFAQTRPASSEAPAKLEEKPALSLHQAAAAGDLERVQALLAQGSDVNEKDKNGLTPLHEAVAHRRRGVVQMLLAKDANVDARDASGRTPLLRASSIEGPGDVPALLLAKGANVNACDNRGNTPLHAALGPGGVNRDFLEFLLSKGANVKARNEQGETPLHLAPKTRGPAEYTKQRGEAADVLLAHGAEVDAPDNNGRTPLHVAAQNNQAKVVELLLAKGAAVDKKTKDGLLALHSAVMAGHKEIVALLLAKGANVNTAQPSGQTPLHVAAQAGYNEIAELLIAKGAEVNAKNARGETPAQVALAQDPPGTVRLLLARGGEVSTIQLAAYAGDLAKVKGYIEKGTSVNTQDGYGLTALHAAAAAPQKEVVEYLIAAGAFVNAASAADGLGTPLHYAAHSSSTYVADLLVLKGAPVDVGNSKGETPLHLAAQMGHTDLCRRLISSKANVNFRARNKWTPLHYAAASGQKDAATLLLEKGADIDASAGGRTPLYMAASRRHKEVVKLLVDRGADVSASSTDLLYNAAWRGYKELAEACIKKGANVNSKAWGDAVALFVFYDDGDDSWGDVLELLLAAGANPNANDGSWSLLHYAVYEDISIVRNLLDKGANPNVIDGGGKSPLHYAAEEGRGPAVELLIAKGANVNARADHSQTPLSLAEGGGYRQIVDLLRKHGAKA